MDDFSIWLPHKSEQKETLMSNEAKFCNPFECWKCFQYTFYHRTRTTTLQIILKQKFPPLPPPPPPNLKCYHMFSHCDPSYKETSRYTVCNWSRQIRKLFLLDIWSISWRTLSNNSSSGCGFKYSKGYL